MNETGCEKKNITIITIIIINIACMIIVIIVAITIIVITTIVRNINPIKPKLCLYRVYSMNSSICRINTGSNKTHRKNDNHNNKLCLWYTVSLEGNHHLKDLKLWELWHGIFPIMGNARFIVPICKTSGWCKSAGTLPRRRAPGLATFLGLGFRDFRV